MQTWWGSDWNLALPLECQLGGIGRSPGRLDEEDSKAKSGSLGKKAVINECHLPRAQEAAAICTACVCRPH